MSRFLFQLLIAVLLLPLSSPAQSANEKFETILEIGLDEEFQLGRIAGASRDTEGSIVFADRSVNKLYRIDPETMDVQTITSEGAGPGELSGFWIMSRIRNTPGRIIISKIGERRLEIYEAGESGDYIHTGTHDIAVTQGRFPAAVYMLSSGKKMIEFGAARSGAENEDTQTHIKMIDEFWNVADERLYTLPEGNQSFVFSHSNGSVSMVPVPYGVRNYHEILPSGSMLAINSHEFRLELIDMDGNKHTLVEEDFTGKTVSSAEVRELRNEYGRMPELRPMFDLIPSTKPFICQLLVDYENRIWIIYTRGDAAFARAYTHEGVFLLEIPFPSDYSLRDVRNGEMLIEYGSDDDFPHLKLVKANF